jgi:parvulin-like peptidyl-prolyl isomerase
MRKPVSLIAIVLAAALLAGCGSSGGGGGGSSALGSDDIIVVGQTHVTKSQFDALMAQAQSTYKQRGQKFPKQGTQEYASLKAQAVAVLVAQAERIDKARSLGVDPSDSDINARLELIKKQYFGGSEKKYEAGIKKQHLTDADVRRDVVYQLVQEGVFNKLGNDVSVSDSDVQSYYNSHKSVYTQRASRDVRYILVKKKTTADKVYNQLVHGNAKTWCTLAKKYAKDASGQNCGKATFSEGQTVPIFDRTAFTAPAGKVHVPFYDPTQYKSWFVIEPLGAVKPSKETPLKTVETQIKQTLLQNKKNQAMNDWLGKLPKTYCSDSKIKYAVGYTASPDPCAATTTAATTG